MFYLHHSEACPRIRKTEDLACSEPIRATAPVRGNLEIPIAMRCVRTPQDILGQTAIEDIRIDPHCRDDIPAVLRGLQIIYCNEDL